MNKPARTHTVYSTIKGVRRFHCYIYEGHQRSPKPTHPDLMSWYADRKEKTVAGDDITFDVEPVSVPA